METSAIVFHGVFISPIIPKKYFNQGSTVDRSLSTCKIICHFLLVFIVSDKKYIVIHIGVPCR